MTKTVGKLEVGLKCGCYVAEGGGVGGEEREREREKGYEENN